MQYELNVGALFSILRRKVGFFLAGIAIVLLLVVGYLHVASRLYTVSMEVTAATQSSQNSRLSGLSSLAGIDLGGGGTGNLFKLYVASLQSPAAAAILARQPGLLREMFPRDWSDRDGRWEEPASGLRPFTNAIKSAIGMDIVPWSPPSTARVYNYLRDQVQVVQDDKSTVVTLKIESSDPRTAADVLVALNAAGDALIRKRSLSRAEGYIKYITDMLPTVTIAEYRSALIENLNEQVGTRMMAEAGVPFVSDVLSPPLVSPTPTSPSAFGVLALGFFLGCVLGAALAFLADYLGWEFAPKRLLTRPVLERRPGVVDENGTS